MTIKWYNRDSISDLDMKQARLIAEKLQGKKEIEQSYLFDLTNVTMLKPRRIGLSYYQSLLLGFRLGLNPAPAPQWEKDDK